MKPLALLGISVTTCVTLLAACSSPSSLKEGKGVVSIQTDRTVYVPGDPVHFTIENVGAFLVGYNPCPFALERQAGNGWAEFNAEPDSPPCELQIKPLAPSATAQFLLRLPPVIGTGTYRFRFETIISDDNAPLPLANRVSNPFVIR